MPITFAVLLWPIEGREVELAAYEDDVLALVGAHGGRLLRRVRSVDPDLSHPRELHLIEFADHVAFDSFRADPRRAALADRRDASVAKTVMWRVEDVT